MGIKSDLAVLLDLGHLLAKISTFAVVRGLTLDPDFILIRVDAVLVPDLLLVLPTRNSWYDLSALFEIRRVFDADVCLMPITIR